MAGLAEHLQEIVSGRAKRDMVEVVARRGSPTRHLQRDDLVGLHRDDKIRIVIALSDEIDPGHPTLRLLQGPVRPTQRRYCPVSGVANHERAEMEAGPR